ncbi:hypothetical protein ACIHCQ_41040 [Streptomyces sp. NPDC052236]|uniref:hypothetical protein n=1 Tax=Streptomyces sp. NPDC052236 TaxID=3365686 RepID=UPI0037D8D560
MSPATDVLTSSDSHITLGRPHFTANPCVVKQLKGTKAAAQALGISQRTVERYVSGKLKRPRQELRGRLEREVKKR